MTRWKIPPEEAYPTHELAVRHDTSPGVPSEPEVKEYGPDSYWMSSPSEAARVGVPHVWRKSSGGYDLPDPDNL